MVTADISLADAVISNVELGLNPQGCLYTQEEIKKHLTTRNLTTELREIGIASGGRKALQ